jgi:hypothetical protein
MVEAAFAKLTVQKPQPQEIVAQLLAEQTLAPDTVERRQDPRLQQLLGRDAIPSTGGVQFIEQRRKLLQDQVNTLLDRAQRMIGRHTLVEVDHRQKVRLGLRFSAHAYLTSHFQCWFQTKKTNFNTLLVAFKPECLTFLIQFDRMR